MNCFYSEQILYLGPSTSSVPQHHLTKPSILHKGIRHFLKKISMFKMLLLHSSQSEVAVTIEQVFFCFAYLRGKESKRNQNGIQVQQ